MSELAYLVAVCGVGADLATLPLCVVAFLLVNGIVAAPEWLAWLGTWQLFGTAGLVVLVEILFDTLMDRRQRFLRRSWLLLQQGLTVIVSLIVVLALGQRLELEQQIATLASVLVATGVLRAGLFNQMRTLCDSVLPRSGAKRALVAASVPPRLAAASAFVYLGRLHPRVALGLLVFAVALGLVGLLASSLLWRGLRARARMDCSQCDYRPLRIARICPKCRTPMLVQEAARVSPAARLSLLQGVIALTRADDMVSVEEVEFLRACIRASGMNPADAAGLEGTVAKGISIDEIATEAVSPADRERILSVAAATVVADGRAAHEEEETYARLAARLGFGKRRARACLNRYRRMAACP